MTVFKIKGSSESAPYGKYNHIDKREFTYLVLAENLSKALLKVEIIEKDKDFWEDIGFHKSEFEKVSTTHNVIFKSCESITGVDIV